MLSPYRVLDLSNERGLLCGQVLADLGADVIQVEPPGGSSARRCGPFAKGEAGAERSLFWWSYTRNKRSVVLDLTSSEGLESLLDLVRGADFLIESDRPGDMKALGLDYAALSEINPGLVYVSISAFGQTGPKADWLDSDLTHTASAGTAYLSGDAQERPVRLRTPQGHCHAGTDAAVGALIAHVARKRTGRGQHVDISIQQSMTLATMHRALDAPLQEAPARRISGGVHLVGNFISGRHALKNGWVVLGPGWLPSTGHFMKRLLEYARDEGFGDDELIARDWSNFALNMISGQVPGDAYESTAALLDRFFATRTTTEIMREAVDRKLLIAPILRIDEIVESEQLADRNYEVTHTDPTSGVDVRYPGAFAKFGASPIEYRRSAPSLDQHGEEIRNETPREPSPCEGNGGTGELDRPLKGLKVLDLFWILAGPASTRMLADYGATVVRIESTTHIDTLRVITPYQFANPHPEGAGCFQSANANKLGMTLDITSDEGRALILKLVEWADVVTESFASGVMAAAGLDYESLRKHKPDIIMISSCLMGQTGPWRRFTGFGNLAASVTSFQQLASWPGNPPSGPFGAYTDFVAARYNAIAILSALEYRERTGQGQYIDQSQAEAALHYIAPTFLDYTVNGNVQGAAGNTDGESSPHDFYPCEGEDRWVAIAVREDAQWNLLCDLMQRADLLDQRENVELVDRAISEWTSLRTADEATSALQSAGIPSHPALDTPGLFEDSQLQHREHYVEIGHEIYQTTTIESSRLKLSESKERVPEMALSQGRDNRLVLESILGYSKEQIDELIASNVIV
jgi:crotonobetainyl-CoA:carnitine CoA-transferase CaiB-like acyl-CoA transferase